MKPRVLIVDDEPRMASAIQVALSRKGYACRVEASGQAALDALEPSFREVVVLSVVGDLTYREVAQVLDCPMGTVMSRMARARRALRERLADYARAKGWAVERRS